VTDFLSYYPLWVWALCSVCMCAGGFVKGAVGFALPMIAVSCAASFMPPQEAVAAVILPTLITNVWQSLRQGFGPAFATLREYWRLNLTLALTIAGVSQLVPRIPPEVFFIVLGSIILIIALIQLFGVRLPCPETQAVKTRFEVITGLVGGLCGGMAGFWGPPILLFLIAMGVEKTNQIRAQGLSYTVGSVMLVGGHLSSGVLNEVTLPLSGIMVLPVLIGMGVGLWVQDRLDQQKFRRFTLIVLCLTALNMLRKGLLG